MPGVDQRSTWVRRAKDLIELVEADRGGADNLAEAERALIRRAAVIATELERLEAKFAVAGEISAKQFDLYQRGCNTLRRLLETIGLRKAKADTAPLPLSDYIAKARRPVHAEEA